MQVISDILVFHSIYKSEDEGHYERDCYRTVRGGSTGRGRRQGGCCSDNFIVDFTSGIGKRLGGGCIDNFIVDFPSGIGKRQIGCCSGNFIVDFTSGIGKRLGGGCIDNFIVDFPSGIGKRQGGCCSGNFIVDFTSGIGKRQGGGCSGNFIVDFTSGRGRTHGGCCSENFTVDFSRESFYSTHEHQAVGIISTDEEQEGAVNSENGRIGLIRSCPSHPSSSSGCFCTIFIDINERFVFDCVYLNLFHL